MKHSAALPKARYFLQFLSYRRLSQSLYLGIVFLVRYVRTCVLLIQKIDQIFDLSISDFISSRAARGCQARFCAKNAEHRQCQLPVFH